MPVSHSALCALPSDDKLDITIRDLKESKHLIDRLAVVGLIHEPVELGGRGSEPPDDFPLGQRGGRDALLGFEGQPVQEQVSLSPAAVLAVSVQVAPSHVREATGSV
jgi:hypothetical protein